MINPDIFEFKPKKKFDFITMGEVLEHIEEPDKFLLKIKSLLNESCKFYIGSTSNFVNWENIHKSPYHITGKKGFKNPIHPLL